MLLSNQSGSAAEDVELIQLTSSLPVRHPAVVRAVDCAGPYFSSGPASTKRASSRCRLCFNSIVQCCVSACKAFVSVLQGLVKYEYSSGQVSILASWVSPTSSLDPGSEITYANDLAIASDGKVYFTSCTDIVPAVNKAGYYDTFRAWMLGLAQVSVCRGLQRRPSAQPRAPTTASPAAVPIRMQFTMSSVASD